MFLRLLLLDESRVRCWRHQIEGHWECPQGLSFTVPNCLALGVYPGVTGQILEGNMDASVKIEGYTDNVAGVKMPIFRQLDTGDDQSNEQQLGLSGGGRAIKNCREKFGVLLNLMVRLASLQVRRL